MKTIQVFDPPRYCSTGVCGTEIDADLVNFAAMLAQLASHGVMVERFNLGQQPVAFTQNVAVKALPEKEGPKALPLIFPDGELRLKGRYPTAEKRPEFFQAALGRLEQVTL